MRTFLYYFIHSLTGSIKKLFRNKVIAVILAFIVGFAVLGGIVGVTIGTVFSSVTEESGTVYEETADDLESESQQDMSQEDIDRMYGMVEAAAGGCLLLVILLFVYTGDKSGVKIFNMADVNFLFSSPMKPQSVLLFRTLMQMGVVLISSLYLLGQIPNLMNNLGMSLPQCLFLFAGWIIALFIGKMTSVFAYTVTATYPRIRKYLKPVVLIIGAAPILLVIALICFGGKDIFDAVIQVFAARGTRWIPLFGWFRGLILSLLFQQYLSAAGFFAALVAFSAGISWLIWHIKADFYEDALQGADELQKRLEKRQKGVKTRKKERSDKIARNTEMKGVGAEMFLSKTVYNRRRFAKFVIGTPTAITYAFISALLCGFLRFAIRTDLLLPVGVVFCIVIFFRNLGNPVADEINHPFFFLVPESPYSKVRYATVGALYECFFDLFPAYIIAQFLMNGDSAELLLWLVLWLSLDLLCTLSGLFIEMLLPTFVVPAIKGMLAVSIRMAVILPGILLLLLSILIGMIWAVICVIALNLTVSALLFAIAPRFLHAGKN